MGGMEDQRYRLIRVLERNVRSIGLSTSGGAVMHAALAHAAPEDKIWTARAVLQEPDVLRYMATDRHGSAAVVKVLQALQSQERERARASLLESADVLRSSKFGHVVLAQLAPSSTHA